MIETAVWKPTKFLSNGQMVTLRRGQFAASIRDLADRWGWSKSRVERFIGALKTETMVETDAGTGRLIITVCNYDIYQPSEAVGGTPPETPGGTRAGHERDTKEEDKKGTMDPPTEDSSNLFDASPADPIPYREMVEAWNQICGDVLARVTKHTDRRRQQLKRRYNDDFGRSVQQWEAYCHRIRASDFLTGKAGGDRAWLAGFDWALKPASVAKVLEGNYDNRRRSAESVKSARNF